MPRAGAVALGALLAALGALPAAGIEVRGVRRAPQKGHRSAKRHRELLVAASGDCRCLNWMTVFTKMGGRCGQGYERFLPRGADDAGAHLKTGLFQELWEGELCDRVFSRLDTDSCVQQNMGEGSTSAQAGWCYVSSACRSDKLDLRNTSKAGNSSHGLRMCVPGVDRFLYEKSPQELQELGARQGPDMGHLVKLAYPTMGASWEKVSAFFTMNSSLFATTEFSTRLRRTAARGNTVVWSSRNGLPPFGVTMGTRAWEVGLRPRARRAVLSDPNNLEVWANVTKFRCLSGCLGSQVPSDAPVLLLGGDAAKKPGAFPPGQSSLLGEPWARGRGVVQMRRRKKGDHHKPTRAQA